MITLGDFRFEYEMEYENEFSILVCRLHITISSHEHPSLLKTKTEMIGAVKRSLVEIRESYSCHTSGPIDETIHSL